jgi:HEAT repeat protein
VPSEKWLDADRRVTPLKRARDVEGLIRELGHGGERRRQALWALSRVGDRRAVEPLSRLLANDRPGTRRWAAIALGRIGDPAATPALLAALGDPAGAARCYVIPMPSLWSVVRRPRQTVRDFDQELDKHEREWFEGKVLDAVARLGAREAVPAFLILLKRDEPSMRQWAARSLGRIGDPSALGALHEARGREPLHRRRAYWQAIRQIQRGSSSARP